MRYGVNSSPAVGPLVLRLSKYERGEARVPPIHHLRSPNPSSPEAAPLLDPHPSFPAPIGNPSPARWWVPVGATGRSPVGGGPGLVIHPLMV